MDNSFDIIIFSVDFTFTEIIKRIMEKADLPFNYKILSSFSDAAAISSDNSIDLMIIDDMIIGTSGYELISFLRLSQKIVSPIIYFGVAEYDGKRKAYLSGANRFIIKPFNPDELVKRVQKFLSPEKV